MKSSRQTLKMENGRVGFAWVAAYNLQPQLKNALVIHLFKEL
jgi:hypothetical protein